MRVKSPLRLAVAILILLMLIYAGVAGAVSIITGKPVQFGFWSRGGGKSAEEIQDFVVAGTDEDGIRTDLILLCRYNLNDNSITALQIHRDTKVETDRYDKKINSAYGTAGKEVQLADEIEQITGIRPEKHVIISFKAFRELIDAIGGVEVEVPMRMYYTDPFQNLTIDLYPGVQVLDGRRAEMFMRFRHNNDGSGYPNGDIDRVAAQKKFYEAAMDKLLSGGTILKAPKILSIISKNVKTDFTGEEILKYISKIPSFSMEKVKILTLPGEGGYGENGVSYFFYDEKETELLVKENFLSKKKATEEKKIASAKNKFVKVKLIDATGIPTEEADILKVTSDMLSEYQFKIISTEKTDRIQDSSKLINHNSKNAAELVQQVYSGIKIQDGIELYVKKDGEKVPDVTLVIGADFIS